MGPTTTRFRGWRVVAAESRATLARPRYAALAVAGALAVLTVTVVAHNWRLVTDVIVGGGLPPAERIGLVVRLYPVVSPVYGPARSGALVALAALAGLDLALVGRHLGEFGAPTRGGGGGTVGLALGLLGAGCPSCGQALVVGALSLFGGTGLLAGLPLGGLEFLLVAFLPLAASVRWLAAGLRAGREGCRVG